MAIHREEPTPSIFKAYDVRGRYPSEVNERVVSRIAAALAGHFDLRLTTNNLRPATKKKRKTVVVIGHDARLSSPALYRALRKSLVASRTSLVILPAGRITTPMLYFLVNRHRAAGGIMVTASHNPPEWNGLKAVGRGAVPISGREVRALIEPSAEDEIHR